MLWIQDEEPTKKGIRLSGSSWQLLLGVNEHLVADMFSNLTKRQWVNNHYPIDEGIYVSITSPWKEIDLYVWYIDECGLLKPSKKGISLKFPQWRKLVALSTEIADAMPDLDHMS